MRDADSETKRQSREVYATSQKGNAGDIDRSGSATSVDFSTGSFKEVYRQKSQANKEATGGNECQENRES
jgi:hypothetical protein